jgi:hypothetical protein
MVATAKTCPAQTGSRSTAQIGSKRPHPLSVCRLRNPHRPKLGSHRRADAAGDHQAASTGPSSRVTDTTTRFATDCNAWPVSQGVYRRDVAGEPGVAGAVAGGVASAGRSRVSGAKRSSGNLVGCSANSVRGAASTLSHNLVTRSGRNERGACEPSDLGCFVDGCQQRRIQR